jgi:hypothetical protein
MKKTIIISGICLMIGSAVIAGSKFESTIIAAASSDTGQSQIEYSKLPANIQYAIKEQYPNFEPQKMVTKIEAEGTTLYYVTVESDKRIIGLRCSTDGEIFMQSSSRKAN